MPAFVLLVFLWLHFFSVFDYPRLDIVFNKRLLAEPLLHSMVAIFVFYNDLFIFFDQPLLSSCLAHSFAVGSFDTVLGVCPIKDHRRQFRVAC